MHWPNYNCLEWLTSRSELHVQHLSAAAGSEICWQRALRVWMRLMFLAEWATRLHDLQVASGNDKLLDEQCHWYWVMPHCFAVCNRHVQWEVVVKPSTALNSYPGNYKDQFCRHTLHASVKTCHPHFDRPWMHVATLLANQSQTQPQPTNVTRTVCRCWSAPVDKSDSLYSTMQRCPNKQSYVGRST